MKLNVQPNMKLEVQNTNTDRLALIENLDLEPIKYKLVREKNWSLADADRVEILYKAFLQLHLLYPNGTHVPTEDIDEMWHAHILDTAKYMVDCFTVFGHYLHHFPYLGMKDAADAENLKIKHIETKNRMLETGMIDPNSPDGIVFADCGGGGGCGSSSCGSSSCSSSPSSCGTTPSSCSSLPFPVPASCSNSPPTRTNPDRDRPSRPTPPQPQKPSSKPSWWPWRKRGGPDLSLSGWMDTVDPTQLGTGFRPGRADLLSLSKTIH